MLNFSDRDFEAKYPENPFSKKRVKTDANLSAILAFLYCLVMVVVSSVYVRLYKAIAKLNSVPVDTAHLQESGVMYLICVGSGLLLLLIIKGRRFYTEDLRYKKRSMKFSTFLALVAFFMLLQVAFDIIAIFLEATFNLFGFSLLKAIEIATTSSSTISMFLYASFFGPLCEELIFRGAILNTLKPYGKKFAIVFSAFLFAVAHGNLPQGFFAFGAGLLFGYVAVEYSIWWSLALHVVNNCIFGNVLAYLGKILGTPVGQIIDLAIIGIVAVCGLMVLIFKRQKIVAYLKKGEISKKYVKYFFSSVWVLIFIAVMVAKMLCTVTPVAG